MPSGNPLRKGRKDRQTPGLSSGSQLGVVWGKSRESQLFSCPTWVGVGGCYWHLVGRGQRCGNRFYNAQNILLRQRITWPQTSVSAKVEKL